MPTLQQYRQSLASSRDLGGYIAFTATSTSASSTATKEIICSSLIDDTPNVTGRYAGIWLYGTSDGTVDTLAGIQRQVRQFGLDPSTGTLTVTNACASVPQSGATWEGYYRIPAIRDTGSGRDGYREIINEALRLMTVPDRMNVAGVADQTKYPLNTSQHPWLREPGRIVNVWRPTPNASDLERIDPQAWRLIRDGEALILQLPSTYAAGDIFKLEVKRPANSRLLVGGAWIDQTSLTAGLTNDSDEAIPSINDVVAVARELAFAELQRVGPEADVRFWAAKEADAARAAAGLKFARQEPTEPYRPLALSGVGDIEAFR